MKKSGLIILAVFLLLFSVSCDTSFFSHDGQKVTVMVVGLDYARKGESTTNLSWGSYSIPQLNGTINDSKEIGAALDSLYRDRDIEHEMVFLISDGGVVDFDDSLYPTSSKVLKAIDELKLKLDKDDLFVFYFAGHGFLQQRVEGGVVKNNLQLITAEQYNGSPCTSLDYETLLASFRSLPCRSAVIIDACYSGSFDPMNNTTPASFESSIRNIFEENIVTREDNKISVLAAAKWNERSWEGYKVKFPDNSEEEHGQFSGSILDILGWTHSNTATTVVKNIDGSEIVANGREGKLFGSLSLDDIHSKLFDYRNYPAVAQYPVLYYTNETINLVPAN